MQSMKETAANIAASAKSGMEKTKATTQEKMERMTAHDPMSKEMATQKKHDRMNEAERDKQEARMHNAAVKQAVSGGGGAHMGGYTAGGPGTAAYSTTEGYGHPTGAHQMSAMPGHGTGQVTGGVVGAHPIGTNTGTGRTTAHNTHEGGGGGSAYGTGGGLGTATYSTTEGYGHPTGAHQMSAIPGHGTGQPTGQVTEGTVGAHPIGTNTGTGRTTAHNTHVGGGGGGGGSGYGTGGGYS